MPDTLEDVLRGLTSEERQAIIDCRWFQTSHPISYDAHGNGEYCCERHATVLGLELRARLLSSSGEG